MLDDMIQPADGVEAQAQPEVQPQQPAAPQGDPQLSKNLLKIPAMQALFAGAPPALSASIKDFTAAKRDEAKLIKDNLPALQAAGMGFYKSLSGHLGVIYNMLHLHLADLQAADKIGKLEQLAPSFDHINHAIGKSGAKNPVLAVKGVPKGFKTPTPVAPPQATPGLAPGASGPLGGPVAPAPVQSSAPAPAGVQRKLVSARLGNMQPGAPTSGPSPGAGRLLNAILKPVV